MLREKMIQQMEDGSHTWDIIVIGGGATGLGVGVEAVSRGYSTLLLEQVDFAQGTSSRSTKLIHGGVRYLQQGNLSLVLESLHERGLLLRNAPHLVHHQPFIVPNYEWWEGPFYGIGLKFYDVLAGKLGLGPSSHLSRQETLDRIPTVEPEGLRGGVIYYDGQFDDARLAVALAATMKDLGGCVVNYMQVTALVKESGLVRGVEAQDAETAKSYRLKARAVVNATGIFVDGIRQMDDPAAGGIIAPSQGVHVVLDKSFLPGGHAVMIPHTDDGRVLFAVPWKERVIVGTTDTPIDAPCLEPKPLPQEIDFLLSHAARYLTKDPAPADVLSAFAGIRPLIGGAEQKTASLSRDHHLIISPSGLITIAGGKWTTYRKMGQDTVDQAAVVAGLAKQASRTETLKLHGWSAEFEKDHPLAVYGSDADQLKALIAQDAGLDQLLHPALPYRRVEVIWAVRHEMARTLTDVLSRRTRALVLDARVSLQIAPAVAAIMAVELGQDSRWQQQQVKAYRRLAEDYLIST